MIRGKTCVAGALLCLVLPACTAIGGPEPRIEGLVHDRLAELVASDAGVEVRVGPIRIDAAGQGLYEASVEFDRLYRDEAGIPHIARREQTWLIRDHALGTPEVLRVDERKRLAYPGTGPRIVCY